MNARCAGGARRRLRVPDRGNRTSVVLGPPERDTTASFPLAQYRAGAARALVAALLSPVQMQVFAEKIEQRHVQMGRQLRSRAVNADRRSCMVLWRLAGQTRPPTNAVEQPRTSRSCARRAAFSGLGLSARAPRQT